MRNNTLTYFCFYSKWYLILIKFHFSLTDHETLMDYLSEIPTETSHNLTRTAEANHWNTCETKGIEFVGKLRLTHGLDFKKEDENQSENSIRSQSYNLKFFIYNQKSFKFGSKKSFWMPVIVFFFFSFYHPLALFTQNTKITHFHKLNLHSSLINFSSKFEVQHKS